MIRTLAALLTTVLIAGVAGAQGPGESVPSVTMAPVGKVQLKAGGTANVELDSTSIPTSPNLSC